MKNVCVRMHVSIIRYRDVLEDYVFSPGDTKSPARETEQKLGKRKGGDPPSAGGAVRSSCVTDFLLASCPGSLLLHREARRFVRRRRDLPVQGPCLCASLPRRGHADARTVVRLARLAPCRVMSLLLPSVLRAHSSVLTCFPPWLRDGVHVR